MLKLYKKIFKILCLLVSVFFLHSCTSQESIIVFKLSEQGLYERIDTIFIGVPLNMVMYEDDLFIGDFHEPMIIKYHLADRKTDRFLLKGRGPGETLPPVILCINSCEENKLFRYSKQLFDMGYYSLDMLPAFVPLFKLSYEYGEIIPFEKEQYLAEGMFKDGYRYRVLNTKGEIIHRFGDYPNFFDGENLIPIDARSMYHQASFANNHYQQKLVSVSTHVLDIIDYSSGIMNGSINRIKLASYDYEYTSGNFLSAKKKNGIIKGASEVACDDQFIYILFNPGIVGEENKGINREIWIFDWSGKPIKRVTFDVNLDLVAKSTTINESPLYGLVSTNDGDEYVIVKITGL